MDGIRIGGGGRGMAPGHSASAAVQCAYNREKRDMPSITARKGKDRRIHLRATSAQESLIRAAADRRGVSLTDFVLESACTRAEEAIADQVHFVLSPRQWQAFNDALERPARVLPKHRKLLTEPSVFEQH